MGFFGGIKKTLGKLPGAGSGAWGSWAEQGEDSNNRARALGLPAKSTPEQITTANLFRNLSPEQQKDLLLNNPNI
jgi:hypothetical protein